MLTTTREKLDALYAGGKHRGLDGQLHNIDSITRIAEQQGEAIAALHREIRPNLSIEIGLAYAFSTLYILDAMEEGGYGRHIAIDPGAADTWRGVGLRAIKEVGLSDRFEWMGAPAADALPKLMASGERAQFVYIDGCHLFDYALVDFFLSDRILDVGGVILLDDLWMPALKRVASFIDMNMCWYERIDVDERNVAVFRKIGHDSRQWDHFVDF